MVFYLRSGSPIQVSNSPIRLSEGPISDQVLRCPYEALRRADHALKGTLAYSQMVLSGFQMALSRLNTQIALLRSQRALSLYQPSGPYQALGKACQYFSTLASSKMLYQALRWPNKVSNSPILGPIRGIRCPCQAYEAFKSTLA